MNVSGGMRIALAFALALAAAGCPVVDNTALAVDCKADDDGNTILLDDTACDGGPCDGLVTIATCSNRAWTIHRAQP